MRLIKLRKFRGEYIFHNGCTGFGIAEYSTRWTNEPTLAIWSLYESRNISNQDAFISILKIIDSELAKDEQAIIQMSKFSYRKNWHVPYKGRLNFHHQAPNNLRFQEVTLLAEDAVRRKTNIFERLESE